MKLEDLALIDTTGTPLPGTIVHCLLCAKPFLMRPYSGIPDQACPECYETYKECASIVCSKCRVVVAKAAPKVLPNGFYVRPYAVLHIDCCNVCNPNLATSTVLEIARHDKLCGTKTSIIVPAKAYKGPTK